MKILVMGGSRFFGKRLVASLLDAEHEVTVFNRGNLKLDFKKPIKHVIGDRGNARDLQALAAMGPWDVIYDQICFDHKQAELAVSAFRGQVKRYIFTSTGSVYKYEANLKESNFIPEKYEYSVVVEQSKNYGEAKRQAEAVFAKQTEFPVVMVRFPIVIGVEDYTKRFLFHVNHIASGEGIYFPMPEAKKSFISSLEAAMCLSHLKDISFTGPINVASESPITLIEFGKLVAEYIGGRLLFAASANEYNASPYGIQSDWSLDVSKAKGLGLPILKIEDWLKPITKAVYQKTRLS